MDLPKLIVYHKDYLGLFYSSILIQTRSMEESFENKVNPKGKVSSISWRWEIQEMEFLRKTTETRDRQQKKFHPARQWYSLSWGEKGNSVSQVYYISGGEGKLSPSRYWESTSLPVEQAVLWSQDFPIIGDNQTQAGHYRKSIHLAKRTSWIYSMISSILSNFDTIILEWNFITKRWFGLGLGRFLVSLKFYHITNCLHFFFKWI